MAAARHDTHDSHGSDDTTRVDVTARLHTTIPEGASTALEGIVGVRQATIAVDSD